MKIVFFGSPDFSGLVLESLINSKHQVIGVVTNEDKKVGRKQILTKTPVKIIAENHNIPIFQFHKIRLEGYETLKSLNADIFITCAYGQIISKQILECAKFGTINVHFSLLPAYRGASPVQSALLQGEKITGVTIMRTDEGIDTGDIICQKSLEIESEDNAETLLNKLARLGASMLGGVLESFENGTIKFTKQGDNFSYFGTIKKEDGLIDFGKNSKQIENEVKALYLWPNAYVFLNGKTLKIFKANATEFYASKNYNLGEIVLADKTGLIVACGNNTFLKIDELQLEGGKRLFYKDFLNGNKNLLGTILNGNFA